jgi:hypothetical protein
MDWGTSDTISTLALLTSAASAAYAYKTYRATVELKKHDFSLELQRANETLRAAVSELPELLAQANRSRRAVYAAQGLGKGSAWDQWSARVAEIQSEIEALQKRLPDEDRFDQMDLSRLRDLIVSTHALQKRADRAAGLLNDAMQEDDRRRQQMAEDRRAERGNRATQGGIMASLKRE